MDKFGAEYWRLRLTYIHNESVRMMKHQEEKRTRPVIDPADIDRVKRDLFGPVSGEDNDSYLRDHIKRLSVIEKERWNFDFKKEQPLNEPNARFKWSKDSPKKRNLAAPKPHRSGQQKITAYLPSKKSGESGQKKLKMMMENAKEGDVKGCN